MSAPDERIQAMTVELEQLCPRDGAKVRIKIYGGGADESRLEANRAGYLRLAAECLKAAYAPFTDATRKEQFTIQANWNDLFSNDSDVQIDWFERRDDFTSPSVKRTLMGRLIPALFGILVVAGVVFAIVGVVATFMWLF
ncbi:MAG: hypothetical protein HY043_18610 [Verrucomicrobia bacterium]|nr:hypothetical protein [Verrucomicrobiota bacterium]